jgi:hypothetical protein
MAAEGSPLHLGAGAGTGGGSATCTGASGSDGHCDPSAEAVGQAPRPPAASGDVTAGPRAHDQEPYAIHIYQALKQVHPDLGISEKSIEFMNAVVNHVEDLLLRQLNPVAVGVVDGAASVELGLSNQHTGAAGECQSVTTAVTAEHVAAAVRAVLGADSALAHRAMLAGARAVERYTATVDSDESDEWSDDEVSFGAGGNPGDVVLEMDGDAVRNRSGESQSVWRCCYLGLHCCCKSPPPVVLTVDSCTTIVKNAATPEEDFVETAEQESCRLT